MEGHTNRKKGPSSLVNAIGLASVGSGGKSSTICATLCNIRSLLCDHIKMEGINCYSGSPYHRGSICWFLSCGFRKKGGSADNLLIYQVGRVEPNACLLGEEAAWKLA